MELPLRPRTFLWQSNWLCTVTWQSLSPRNDWTKPPLVIWLSFSMSIWSRLVRPCLPKRDPSYDTFYRHTSNRWIYNEKQRGCSFLSVDSLVLKSLQSWIYVTSTLTLTPWSVLLQKLSALTIVLTYARLTKVGNALLRVLFHFTSAWLNEPSGSYNTTKSSILLLIMQSRS